jgi:hypothetical protein
MARLYVSLLADFAPIGYHGGAAFPRITASVNLQLAALTPCRRTMKGASSSHFEPKDDRWQNE